LTQHETTYPVTLTIDYPDRELNRLTTFFRGFTVIPIAAVLFLLAGPILGDEGDTGWAYTIAFLGLTSAPAALMLVFRRKYPRWWFDWNVNLTAFTLRVLAYAKLLRDEYPSTDEEQAVHLSIPYPDAGHGLDRWLPLVKWLLALPHTIILAFLDVAAGFCVVIAWFAILFTGRYPRGLFDFVTGVLRWHVRVLAYGFMLVTDRYPPFSLSG